MVNSRTVMSNAGTDGYGLDHTVFLQFSAGNDTDNGALSNRIMLKAEDVGISTSRQVPQIPIPFSGTITGESTALSIDLGVARKSVTISGIITDQIIKKNIDGTEVIVNLTAYEVAQLMHSAVDASSFQRNQNFSRLFILYPSRVGDDYGYRTGLAQNTAQDLCPLVPFDYKSRALDASPAQIGSFASDDETSSDYRGITGVVEQFSTNFIAGQPYIGFNLTFTQSFVFSG
tara:strand:- start:1885 stop:2577 length:693 start_codon:yes stop_codon:yes gene_type:complete